jgi:hypothetical protein
VKRLLALASLMVAVGFTSAVAQSPASSPEDVVRQFFKAEDENRWLDAARLLDLRRFETIRRRTVNGLRTVRAPSRLTPEAIMQSDPDMPRAVAEYQAKQMNKGWEEFDLLSFEFARVQSVDTLEALPVDEAAARWLEAKGPKWVEERDRRRAAGRPAMKCPESVDSIKFTPLGRFKHPEAVVLGATADGDSVRYVIVGRRGFGQRPGSQPFESEMSPSVLTLVRVNGAWRIVPTADMITSTGFSGNTSFSIACEIEEPAKARSNQPVRR